MQKREDALPEVDIALDNAIGRIQSFGKAYSNLADTQGEGATVMMRAYLDDLVDGIATGVLPDNVTIARGLDDCTLPREKAVAIGLFINEAMTNSANYAFPDGRAGEVGIAFAVDGDAWSVRVSDDGVGTAAADATIASTGLGARLLNAFAAQANAVYELETGAGGRVLHLRSQ